MFTKALLFLLGISVADIASAAVPTLDASGGFSSIFSSTNVGTVPITTTSTNDIIVIDIYDEATSSPPATVSSVTGAGLMWHNRYSYILNSTHCFSGSSTCFMNLERWWAFSLSTQIAASITVSLSKSIDDAGLTTYGINGAFNNSAPFDVNPALPNVNLFDGITGCPPNSITTSATQNLILGAFGTADFLGSTGVPTVPGVTMSLFAIASNPGGTLDASLWSTGGGTSSKQSANSMTWSYTSTAAICTADAIAGNAVTSPIIINGFP